MLNRHCVLFVAIVVVILSDLCARGASPKTPTEPPANETRATDRQEIRETLVSFAKAFEFGCAGVANVGKALRREAGDLAELK